MSERIFISSVQKELQAERQAVREFVRGDALLRRFFDVFLFEELPASDRRADDVYLDEVGRCAVYLGLFGDEYGGEDAAGISPTEREFDQATAQGKVRLIFVKGADDANRHPKVRALIGKAGAQLIRRRFTSIPDLTAALYASLVEHLERTGKLRTRPFDAAACPDAALTLAQLRVPHPSIPRNPLISEPLFLAHYVERAGTGTLDMIALCRAAGLPEPEFRQDGGQFVQTIWRDWLTAEVLSALALNERQKDAIAHLRVSGRVSNQEYQSLLGVAKRTAHRDLVDLMEKGVIERIGTTGKGTHYVLVKGATKGPNGPMQPRDSKGATKGPNGP